MTEMDRKDSIEESDLLDALHIVESHLEELYPSLSLSEKPIGSIVPAELTGMHRLTSAILNSRLGNVNPPPSFSTPTLKALIPNSSLLENDFLRIMSWCSEDPTSRVPVRRVQSPQNGPRAEIFPDDRNANLSQILRALTKCGAFTKTGKAEYSPTTSGWIAYEEAKLAGKNFDTSIKHR